MAASVGASMDSERILEIMQRAETFPKKAPFRPNLQPIVAKGVIRGGTTSGKKVPTTASGGIVVGAGLTHQSSGSGSSGLPEAGKPLRVTHNQGSAGKMKVKLVR